MNLIFTHTTNTIVFNDRFKNFNDYIIIIDDAEYLPECLVWPICLKVSFICNSKIGTIAMYYRYPHNL